MTQEDYANRTALRRMSADPYAERVCSSCGVCFRPTNSTQRLCGAPCTPRRSRKRKRDGKGITKRLHRCIICNGPFYPAHSRQKRCAQHKIVRSTRRFNNTLTQLNTEYVDLSEFADMLRPYLDAMPKIEPQPEHWPATWQWDMLWIGENYVRAMTRMGDIEYKLMCLKGKGYERDKA